MSWVDYCEIKEKRPVLQNSLSVSLFIKPFILFVMGTLLEIRN